MDHSVTIIVSPDLKKHLDEESSWKRYSIQGLLKHAAGTFVSEADWKDYTIRFEPDDGTIVGVFTANSEILESRQRAVKKLRETQ